MENPKSGFQVDEFKVVYIPERTNHVPSTKGNFECDDVPFPVRKVGYVGSFPGG